MSDSTSPRPVLALTHPQAQRIALALMAAALLLTLALHLLVALLSGLCAYTLHRAVAMRLQGRIAPRYANGVALLIVLVVFGNAVNLAVQSFDVLSSGTSSTSLPQLLQTVMDTLARIHAALPVWIADRLPTTPNALRDVLTRWVEQHLSQVQLWGSHTLRAAVYVLTGLIIGFLVSALAGDHARAVTPFLQAVHGRITQLTQAFLDIVAAQLRIALANTALTAVYVLAVVPLLGQTLPFAWPLVVFAFFASLVPIVGNLASNSLILVMSLTVSPWLALLSLGFLVGIHKLEYFLNARIVGGRVQVRVYELLIAMLVMEAAFGLAGLIAAPIYYAWLVREARESGLA